MDRAHAGVEATEPGFYSKLNEHLAAMDFARQVWALCEPGKISGRIVVDVKPIIWSRVIPWSTACMIGHSGVVSKAQNFRNADASRLDTCAQGTYA